MPVFIKIRNGLNRQLYQDALNLLSPGPDTPFNTRTARRLAQERKEQGARIGGKADLPVGCVSRTNNGAEDAPYAWPALACYLAKLFYP